MKSKKDFNNKKIKEIGDYLFESLEDINDNKDIGVLTVLCHYTDNDGFNSEIRLAGGRKVKVCNLLKPVILKTAELGLDWHELLKELGI